MRILSYLNFVILLEVLILLVDLNLYGFTDTKCGAAYPVWGDTLASAISACHWAWLAIPLENQLECPQANSNRCYRLERPMS